MLVFEERGKQRPGEKRTRKEKQQPTSYSVHQPQDLNTGHLGWR